MNNCDEECRNIEEFLGKIEKNVAALLGKFKPYDEKKQEDKYYRKQKGIYALYLKNPNTFGNGFTYNDKTEDEINKIKKQLAEPNDTLKGEKQNLFYIGKTCNSFHARVTGPCGHMQGGKTSVSNKIYKYLKGKHCKDYSAKNSDKDDVTKWFNENLQVEFYSVDEKIFKQKTDRIISIIEEALIDYYNPPLNSVGCKKSSK